ncbi:hypothetical protein KFE25_014147 [Diacronema lutheri]|uniref:EF-hand domain-containing protein n=1 Tax=Diacronema lutheri TaxID=2081491 RepID=A0A8J5XEI4_DIALT|nr:hypothetical protein KFE25_014147 [Diacronema lutheri]
MRSGARGAGAGVGGAAALLESAQREAKVVASLNSELLLARAFRPTANAFPGAPLLPSGASIAAAAEAAAAAAAASAVGRAPLGGGRPPHAQPGMAAVDRRHETESDAVSVRVRDLLAEWQTRYDAESGSFASLAAYKEFKMRQAFVITSALGLPNRFRTAVSIDCFDKASNVFGRYAGLLEDLRSELLRSIFANWSEAADAELRAQGATAYATLVPYYALAQQLAREKDELRAQLVTQRKRTAARRQLRLDAMIDRAVGSLREQLEGALRAEAGAPAAADGAGGADGRAPTDGRARRPPLPPAGAGPPPASGGRFGTVAFQASAAGALKRYDGAEEQVRGALGALSARFEDVATAAKAAIHALHTQIAEREAADAAVPAAARAVLAFGEVDSPEQPRVLRGLVRSYGAAALGGLESSERVQMVAELCAVLPSTELSAALFEALQPCSAVDRVNFLAAFLRSLPDAEVAAARARSSEMGRTRAGGAGGGDGSDGGGDGGEAGAARDAPAPGASARAPLGAGRLRAALRRAARRPDFVGLFTEGKLAGAAARTGVAPAVAGAAAPASAAAAAPPDGADSASVGDGLALEQLAAALLAQKDESRLAVVRLLFSTGPTVDEVAFLSGVLHGGRLAGQLADAGGEAASSAPAAAQSAAGTPLSEPLMAGALERRGFSLRQPFPAMAAEVGLDGDTELASGGAGIRPQEHAFALFQLAEAQAEVSRLRELLLVGARDGAQAIAAAQLPDERARDSAAAPASDATSAHRPSPRTTAPLATVGTPPPPGAGVGAPRVAAGSACSGGGVGTSAGVSARVRLGGSEANMLAQLTEMLRESPSALLEGPNAAQLMPVAFVLEHIANVYTHLCVAADKQKRAETQTTAHAAAAALGAAGARATAAGARAASPDGADLSGARGGVSESVRPDWLLRQLWGFYLMTYGLKSIARRQVCALIANVKAHASRSARVRAFAALLGCAHGGEPAPAPAPAAKVRFFLAWLPASVGLDRLRFALEGEPCLVPLLDLTRAASSLPLSPAIADAVHEHFEPIMTDPARGFTYRLELDVFLAFACDLWEREHAANRRALAQHWQTADANGDGIIAADEFVALVRRIAPAVAESHAMKLYHATIDESARLLGTAEGDNLQLDAFLSVAASYELRAASLDTQPGDADADDAETHDNGY